MIDNKNRSIYFFVFVLCIVTTIVDSVSSYVYILYLVPSGVLFFLTYLLLKFVSAQNINESDIIEIIAWLNIFVGTVVSILAIFFIRGFIPLKYDIYASDILDGFIFLVSGPLLLICGIYVLRLSNIARKGAIIINLISIILYSEYPNRLIFSGPSQWVPAPNINVWIGYCFWIFLLMIFLVPIIHLNRQEIKVLLPGYKGTETYWFWKSGAFQYVILLLGVVIYSTYFYLNFKYGFIW